MPKWLKNSFKILGALVALVLIVLIGASAYIYFNKAKVIRLVNAELTKSLDGTLTIGDMQPHFFSGLPNISLALKDVSIRDKRYTQHHHSFLEAKDFDVSINAGQLLKGIISINHISISNAVVDVYTDSSGYSNSSVFKKDSTKKVGKTGNTSTTLEKFSLTNVGLKIDDRKNAKLFSFIVNDLDGNMSYPDTGWHAAFHLDVMAKSMTFNMQNGSFIKDRNVEGDLHAGFNKNTGNITVTADALDIGDNPFKVNALFQTLKKPSAFAIHLAADKILWRNASGLVSPNITEKLNQFNIAEPIAVTAAISGSFEGGDDPLLYITAAVKNNTVTIPGSTITKCSFDGVFTNNYLNGKGLSDENSVIRFKNMTGLYQKLPFTIDSGNIVNLNKSIATGNFRSRFPVADLGALLGNKVAALNSGEAIINLHYKADIVDYRINKPFVAGSIDLRGADIVYKPDNLTLKNTSVSLSFVGDDLFLRNIRLQTGRSIVNMNGSVHNFLNLYYNAPEKILLNLQIRSQDFYLGEFIGFLGSGSKTTTVTDANSGNVVKQLNNVLQKGNAAITLDVANAHYNKFVATKVHAEIQTNSQGLLIKTISLRNSGGGIQLNGDVKKGNALNRMALNATISNVDVRDFFFAFDNFGLKDFTYENLKGSLSAITQITANLSNKGTLLPGSVNGVVNLNLKDGQLVNFKPLQGVGKFAFPFRNLKNISVPNLEGTFTMRGDKIEISPMQISSSVLNLDVAGTYGLTNGTNIAMDIPLRNPKNDTTIADQEKLKKKRYSGIVLHLRAKSDENGKVKIGFNKE
jgi:hypothetical protein